MTTREFLTAVATGSMSTEIAQEAVARLNAMDEKSAQERASKNAENAPIIAKINEVLSVEPKTATQIASVVGVSTSKASALLRKMDVIVGETIVNKRIVKTYAITA